MPDPHVWNRAKNEMELITLGPGAKYQYNFDFRVFVAFNELRLLTQAILTVLPALFDKVESILWLWKQRPSVLDRSLGLPHSMLITQ